MSGLENVPEQVQQQYSALYGAFAPGDYPFGSQIPGEGEVIWSFLSDGGRLIYVCSDRGAFPVEVAASEVREAK